MLRTVMSSLVLLPILAHGQMSLSTGSRPSESSAVFLAEVEWPAAPAASMASLSAVALASHAAIHEPGKTRTVDGMMVSAIVHPGAREFALKGSLPVPTSAPTLTTTVSVDLTVQELEGQPSVSNVVLRAIVDENGIPRNVAVVQSAGELIDRKAVAAVTRYRFSPATVDHKRTWATVSIAIKIQKP